MLNIHNIELELTNNAKKYFNTSIKAEFKPSCDLNLGDFYTDYCILLAKEYKKDILEVYNTISKDLVSDDYEISLVGDYLNIKLKKFYISHENLFEQQSQIKNAIIFIPVIKSYTKSLFCRLSFLGMLNAILLNKLGVNTKLILGSKENCFNNDDFNINEVSKNLEKFYDEAIKDTNILEKIYDIDNSFVSELFIIHLGADTFYQRTVSKEIFKTKNGQSHFILKFHSKDWCEVYKEDEYELLDFISSHNDTSFFYSLMYMLSTNRDFKEINYFDAELNAEENFIYFLKSTFERIKEFFNDEYTVDNKNCVFLATSKQRNIIVRAYLLNAVLENLILKGEVGNFLMYFDALLRDVNYALNCPAFRSKLLTHNLSNEEIFVFNYVKVVFQDFLR